MARELNAFCECLLVFYFIIDLRSAEDKIEVILGGLALGVCGCVCVMDMSVSVCL